MIANEAPSIARTGTLQNYNAAVDLIERNLAARAGQDRLHRRAWPLQFRRACRARESLRQRAHRPRPACGSTGHGLPYRHHRLSVRIPRRN